jgi:hypothetical protein
MNPNARLGLAVFSISTLAVSYVLFRVDFRFCAGILVAIPAGFLFAIWTTYQGMDMVHKIHMAGINELVRDFGAKHESDSWEAGLSKLKRRTID